MKSTPYCHTDQFNETLAVQQQVLWLQIPVHDVDAVQVVQRLDHARRHKTRGVVVETPAVPKQRPHLAAQTRLHQHVHVLIVLVRPVKSAHRENRHEHKSILLYTISDTRNADCSAHGYNTANERSVAIALGP